MLPVQSVPIITKVVSLNPAHGKVYSIQHCVIKFVNDLRQVDGFLRVLRFPPPMKLTAMDITEIFLKVALNTITLTLFLHLPVSTSTNVQWQIFSKIVQAPVRSFELSTVHNEISLLYKTVTNPFT